MGILEELENRFKLFKQMVYFRKLNLRGQSRKNGYRKMGKRVHFRHSLTSPSRENQDSGTATCELGDEIQKANCELFRYKLRVAS